jgi:photosystem II stability/assembly factor-like uncharacterized protein
MRNLSRVCIYILFAMLILLASSQQKDDSVKNKYTKEKSSDGWVRLESGTMDDLYFVQFLDINTGWVVGAGGTILHTIDGGAHWLKQESRTPCDLWGCCFVSSDTGWAVGSHLDLNTMKTFNAIFYTTNGGKQWFQQYISEESLYSHPLRSIYFTDSKNGWAVGEEGTFLRTNDGGKTWAIKKVNNVKHLRRIFFINKKTGWLVGYPRTVMTTFDGGITWRNQDCGPLSCEWEGNTDFWSIYFLDANTGWVVGEYSDLLTPMVIILRTTDGGKSWKAWRGTCCSRLSSVYFVNKSTGWVVGFDGMILKTTDNGETWRQQDSGTSERLFSVCFSDTKIGWVVGGNGLILKTTTGGEKH